MRIATPSIAGAASAHHCRVAMVSTMRRRITTITGTDRTTIVSGRAANPQASVAETARRYACATAIEPAERRPRGNQPHRRARGLRKIRRRPQQCRPRRRPQPPRDERRPLVGQPPREREHERAAESGHQRGHQSGTAEPDAWRERQSVRRRILRKHRRFDEDVHLLEERGERRGGCGPVSTGEDLGLQEVGALVVDGAGLVKRAPHDADDDEGDDAGDGRRPAARQQCRCRDSDSIVDVRFQRPMAMIAQRTRTACKRSQERGGGRTQHLFFIV